MLRRIDVARKWLELHLWILLIPFAWPAIRPFLVGGLTRSFDAGLHMLRLGALDRYIRDGVLLPRWTPELLLGYGYPLFSYYAPATYYVAEGMMLLGFDVYHAFVASMAGYMLAAAFGMYFFSLALFGRKQRLAAIMAATAYLYAPYLLTNVYIRGALAEAGAQALLPWILLFAREIFYSERPSRYYLPFAASLALLAVTHNITLLFLPPLLLGYLVLLWWLTGRSRRRLMWASAGIATAMGISAFFWLPLVLERHYLAGTAYEISRTVWLPSAVWNWHNFLDVGLTFTHSFARPIRLGVVQLALALAGFVLARRRDAEWIYFACVACLSAFAMTAWALPVWLNVEILAVAQFPWRLLSILSLPLALFTGGIGLLPRSGRARLAVALTVIGVIIVAHRPQLAWMDVYAPETVDVSAAVFAQTEVEKGILGGGEGNSSIQEFRPKWADRTLLLTEDEVSPAANPFISVLRANRWAMELQTNASDAFPLRFTDFHFPGWRVFLDDDIALDPYPSTNLGLRTVDVPAGEHTISIEWAGTRVQRFAAIVSLFALAIAAVFGWRVGSRILSAGLVIVLVIGVAAVVHKPSLHPVTHASDGAGTDALRLLAYHADEVDDNRLTLYPYWYVSRRVEEDIRFTWTLFDDDGVVRAETIAEPYYNTYGVQEWPSSTLVDDAVVLNLPADLPGGEYRLQAAAESVDTDTVLFKASLGEMMLAGNSVDATSDTSAVDARFGDSVRLTGYKLLSPRRMQRAGRDTPAMAAGGNLRLLLKWQGVEPVPINYHSFVHLVDHLRKPLVQEDQLPGPIFQPPRLWDRFTFWPDAYLLRIPDTAESGLYWPAVGVYVHETEDRLTAYIGDGQADDVLLPPVKIIGKQDSTPDQPIDYALGDFAWLRGYSLEPTGRPLAPGEEFTVTLHFESRTTTDKDLVRFVQLVGPDGVFAQQDAPPQDGANPTWAWVVGEHITDSVEVALPSDLPAAEYRLYAGLYDPSDDGRRVPVLDAEGSRVPDDWVELGSVRVASP